MELQEYFYIIRKRLALIIVVTLLFTLTSAILSYFVISPTYKADISVIIGRNDVDPNKAVGMNYSDVMMYQQLVKTYSVLATSRTVAEDVIKKLDLNISPSELQSMITVAPKGNTEFLTITVKSKKPDEAMTIANQAAKSLKDVSTTVEKSDNVRLLDQAQLPTAPDSPRPKLNMAIALFIGLMVSVGIVFLIEYLDNTVKTPEDIEKLIGVPVVGIIPLVDELE